MSGVDTYNGCAEEVERNLNSCLAACQGQSGSSSGQENYPQSSVNLFQKAAQALEKAEQYITELSQKVSDQNNRFAMIQDRIREREKFIQALREKTKRENCSEQEREIDQMMEDWLRGHANYLDLCIWASIKPDLNQTQAFVTAFKKYLEVKKIPLETIKFSDAEIQEAMERKR